MQQWNLPRTKKPEKEKPNKGDSLMARVLGNKLYRQLALVLLSVVLCVILIFAITTAWYSNVIYSDGLNFKASPWGFEGSASIGSDIITAAPGSSGVISLTVTNPTDQIISVGINISKNPMDTDIQKRIYFFADYAATENGEKLDKTYINKLKSYEYTLLSGQEIVSGGEKNNNTQIKWEWVYDVLGYYVLGKFDENDSMVVEDYLRPVEYDYDTATFDDDGKLLTVDGEKTVAEFVEEITGADGYEGYVSKETDPENGYYRIDVDDDGFGVWLYLCSRGEIEYSTDIDTRLGAEMANEETPELTEQFKAILNVVGQQKKLNIVEASSVDAFVNAISDETCDMVQLNTDISINSAITVPAGKEMIVDLNGYSLNSSVAGDMITVDPGASLAVLNGTVCGDSAYNYAFFTKGGELSLIGVNINDMFSAIYIQDQYGDGGDSRVFISDCEIETANPSVVIFGNGLKSERLSCLTVENSKITSTDYVAIMGNGSSGGDGYWGTDIVITGCELTGYYSGIYQPQRDSFMKISNSTVKGYTAISVKGGSVVIDNCTVIACDEGDNFTPQQPAFASSGATDTGDGVYVETNYGWEISVEIKGEDTKITSDEGVAVRQYKDDATNATITVTGGSYSHDVSDYIPEEGYTCQPVDGMYKVTAN